MASWSGGLECAALRKDHLAKMGVRFLALAAATTPTMSASCTSATAASASCTILLVQQVRLGLPVLFKYHDSISHFYDYYS